VFPEKDWLACFPAGTKLRTPDGWKAVEEFRPGDEIVSRPEDDADAANTVQKVVKLLTRSGRLMTLYVGGRRIETTHEHPWWVVGKGWVTANNLVAGDVFVTSEHAEVVLESVEDADRYVAVYNLEVENDHTYFVGDADWGFDVWSHNHHFDEARREAFLKAGMNDPSQIKFSKVDPKTGTVVEFKGPDGAKVGYDAPHLETPGAHHEVQHISWQGPGKRASGGTGRGNIPYEGPQHPFRQGDLGEVPPH